MYSRESSSKEGIMSTKDVLPENPYRDGRKSARWADGFANRLHGHDQQGRNRDYLEGWRCAAEFVKKGRVRLAAQVARELKFDAAE